MFQAPTLIESIELFLDRQKHRLENMKFFGSNLGQAGKKNEIWVGKGLLVVARCVFPFGVVGVVFFSKKHLPKSESGMCPAETRVSNHQVGLFFTEQAKNSEDFLQ